MRHDVTLARGPKAAAWMVIGASTFCRRSALVADKGRLSHGAAKGSVAEAEGEAEGGEEEEEGEGEEEEEEETAAEIPTSGAAHADASALSTEPEEAETALWGSEPTPAL